MKNSRKNAEKFLQDFGNGKSFVDRLQGVQDFVDLLTEYGGKIKNKYIPNDAQSFEVFAIKDSKDSPTGKQAFIGFKLDNGNFHFIGVPYTESIKINKNCYLNEISDEEILKIDFYDYCGAGSVFMTDQDKISYFRNITKK